jgi:8-oxo-dGTP pyrophosphatase MutT (NUDIX family)
MSRREERSLDALRSGGREVQAAAMCYRKIDNQYRVLLITSLTTRRWVIPKGWPMKDRTLSETARIEAFEEAGIVGDVGVRSIGTYKYLKDRGQKTETRCRVCVFPLRVTDVREEFDEAGRRQRKWVSVKEARRCVREAGLKRILADFDPADFPINLAP